MEPDPHHPSTAATDVHGAPLARLSTRIAYANPWMTVREDSFRRQDGSTGLYGVIDKADFALVIATAPETTPDDADADGAPRDGSDAALGDDGDAGGDGRRPVARGFHLVQQYRYPIGRRSWEFPMGTWPAGRAGTPIDLARTELREETGLTAASWRHLGHLHEAPGFCSQGFDVFLATDLSAGTHDREDSEADMVHAFVSEAEFQSMIDDGRIVDGATIASYVLLLRADARDFG